MNPPEETSGSGLVWRVGEVERRVRRIEDMEPAVMRQEIRDTKDDIHLLAKDVSTVKKMLMTFIITFCITAVTLVVLIFTAMGTKP